MSQNLFDGQYLSHVFLMEFPEQKKLFHREDIQENISMDKYALFVHEYWHYLLNISTIARIKDFKLWHHIIPIFSKTLIENADGTSIGLRLGSRDSQLLNELDELHYAYTGGYFEGLNGSKIFDFKVIGKYEIDDYNLTLENKKVPIRKVKIPSKVTTEFGEENAVYILGNNPIEESIANSIERKVFDDGKQVSPIPYLVLNKISEFFNNGEGLDYDEIAILGTLSFLTTDPAYSVVHLIEDYINLKNKHGAATALSKVTDPINNQIDLIIEIIGEELNNLQKIYDNRAPIDTAIKIICDKIRYCLNLRKKDLLFELTPIITNNRKMLNELLFEKVKPCDVLQRLEGEADKINRDILKSFEIDRINLNGQQLYISTLFQIIQCQLDFVKAHFASNSFMRSEIATSVCPYYTICDLKFRKENPEICKTRPWLHFIANAENCMYCSAVATLIGHVKLRDNK